MISLKNDAKIPAAVFQEMRKTFQTYDRGKANYSVTELIDSPRRVQLKHRYSYTMNASDLWAAFIGTIVHKYFESFAGNGLKEVRLFHEVDGVTISGQPDFVDLSKQTLFDYKSGSAISLYNFSHDDWELQLNLYGYLLQCLGITVEQMFVRRVAVDWRPDPWRQNAPGPSDDLPIPVWTISQQEDYLRSRVELHSSAENLGDDRLPPCSSEDMWEKPDVFAVMGKGKKRAVKLCSSEEEATQFINEKESPDLFMEVRRGERTRCERFCIMNSECTQYKEYKRGQG